MDLTVLFSTHNGADVLPFVLDAYARQSCDCTWNMVVVNNASTDETAECLRSYSSRLPLTVINHPVPGKNGALNAALPKLEGSLIVVTDDDAIPAPDLLNQWARIAKAQPDFDLFGGQVDLLFQKEPPAWMLESRFHFAELFAACNHMEGPIDAGDIFGPNMAVRRAVFDKGITFNEAIGPNANNRTYPMGSETEFCLRLESLGYRSFFASGPRVQHIVRPHQVSPSFWNFRAYRHGLGVGLRERMERSEHIIPLRRRLPSVVLGRLRQAKGYLAFRSSLADTFDAHEGLWNYHWHRGYTDARGHPRIEEIHAA
ncbi:MULTISPECIES: glycosyltransferase family 2 protein [unclassified Paracoccus (in: a-proteobacteria)]|uniref:glycosyltransferase family 2 protein n=1 Tax=unclassified Paracoccus (in: a-proteobacteria) TaxID=2688777 RepID=UPI001601CDB7|nr:MULTISPECIES: glycosyltransferase family 2 protein [unclassified Paracoccus (in: a-proteobacteria)]MBB1492211.1 glycosyltransferase family 2 protein [Paracoccus sp. MC1854]MBB1498707.1 glycosyltransferase family 2 protein [Paracoccus sp. MC1862]QQO45609.1 glycosyltransferase family 2 protein [Paracoccus sp. MC1862]